MSARLTVSKISAFNSTTALRFENTTPTHVTFELLRFPREKAHEPPFLGVEELRVVVLEKRGQVLVRQVVEQVQQHHLRLRHRFEVISLRRRGSRGGRRRDGEEDVRSIAEHLEEGLCKSLEDEVDGEEERVGARLGAPVRKDGVRRLED